MLLVHPLPHARITGKFGETGGPYGDKPHQGMDFSCAIGTPIRAAHSGIVHNAEGQRSGLCVYVRAERMLTFYAHLSRQLAASGTRIRAGETLALSGNSGYSTGPHLHFGFMRDAQWVDPAPHLRLLPTDELATETVPLAEKLRWWLEELWRVNELDEREYARTVHESLIRLAYRLENALKRERGK